MSLSRLGITERQLPYAEYREQALNADILLWRPTSMWGRVIAAGTRGPWCHAAAVRWSTGTRRRLMSMQYREGVGSYETPTRDEVAKWPGKCDVFRVPDLSDERRQGIADRLFDNLGGDYSWKSIWLIAMGYLPVLRWMHNVPGVGEWVEGKLAESAALICSSFVADGYWTDGVTFVRRETGLVSPNDIGRSTVGKYLGTLV